MIRFNTTKHIIDLRCIVMTNPSKQEAYTHILPSLAWLTFISMKPIHATPLFRILPLDRQ